ncbi:hypothetical protein F2P81_012057 [Scophthalmus maximus]|uniref:Uncharacterized protein n=1 Tax=Scophthalmus maximus TaxID=52904 RepID=A0A6A4SVM1_SCOMX|nr:hypothetical protein F2P81_012057 [Scophthalmus maximus]
MSDSSQQQFGSHPAAGPNSSQAVAGIQTVIHTPAARLPSRQNAYGPVKLSVSRVELVDAVNCFTVGPVRRPVHRDIRPKAVGCVSGKGPSQFNPKLQTGTVTGSSLNTQTLCVSDVAFFDRVLKCRSVKWPRHSCLGLLLCDCHFALSHLQ